MTVIGVTGHSNLPPVSTDLVRDELVQVLGRYTDELVGLTCLARGADQAFADAVLTLGGALTVVVPSADYFSAIRDEESRRRCDAYLDAAATIVRMDHETAGAAAYTAANHYVVDTSDVIVAVWDGSPPAGNGGTSDTVAYARDRARTVIRVWPDGARRG